MNARANTLANADLAHLDVLDPVQHQILHQTLVVLGIGLEQPTVLAREAKNRVSKPWNAPTS